MEPDEVCASDSKAYDTECHMRVQSCQSKIPLRVEKKGPCGTCYIRANRLAVDVIREYVVLI